jgi:tRNA (adenine37-N6)-methyltransferase
MEPPVVTFTPIGTIRSGFPEETGTPIQGVSHPESLGQVQVFPEYRAGLQDLEGFSHIYLIYFLHRAQGYRLTCTPFMDEVERGVFATRAPCRPNPIGLSVVRLHKIEGEVLTVSEVDIVDGTPLLDIKPYVPHIDARDDVKVGWMESALKLNKHARKADGRFVGPGRGKQK